MLTTLTSRTQPQSTKPQLTLQPVSTIQERLEHAIKNGQKTTPGLTAADLARTCKISPSAVSKWFNEKTKEIKAGHVFAVAKLCKVNPEWLATGEGKPELPKASGRAADIPDHHLDLIRTYAKLPKEIKFYIWGLVTTLAAASSSTYAKWSREMADAAKRRDEFAVHEP